MHVIAGRDQPLEPCEYRLPPTKFEKLKLFPVTPQCITALYIHISLQLAGAVKLYLSKVTSLSWSSSPPSPSTSALATTFFCWILFSSTYKNTLHLIKQNRSISISSEHSLRLVSTQEVCQKCPRATVDSNFTWSIYRLYLQCYQASLERYSTESLLCIIRMMAPTLKCANRCQVFINCHIEGCKEVELNLKHLALDLASQFAKP